MDKFWVVFEYTKAAGGYCGVRTSTFFSDQAAFEKWLEENPQVLERQNIIAMGITKKEMDFLVRQTPLVCRITAAIEEATIDGKINLDILTLEIQNLISLATMTSS